MKSVIKRYSQCSSLPRQVLLQSHDFPLINSNYSTDLSMNEHVQFTLEPEHTHTNTLGMCMCNFDSFDIVWLWACISYIYTYTYNWGEPERAPH